MTSSAGGREDIRSQLHALIRQQSFRTGDFTLTSGRRSRYFFDLKPTMLHPTGGRLLASMVLDVLDEHPEVDAIGGLALGAVPIVSAVAVMSSLRQRPVSGFFVRKSAKGHGTRQRIDGVVEAGQKVVIIDDVTTTGGSSLEAWRAARELGCEVIEVMTVVDRMEGAVEALAEHGLRLRPLFTRADFG